MKNNYFIICQIIYILIVLNCFHFFKDFFINIYMNIIKNNFFKNNIANKNYYF